MQLGANASGQLSGTAWFEADSGLLVKVTNIEVEGTAAVTIETIFSDYRSHGDFKTAHHIETKLGGQQAILDIAEFSINEPVAESIFELPPDVRALRDKKRAEMDKADTDAQQRPSLKK